MGGPDEPGDSESGRYLEDVVGMGGFSSWN